MTLGQLDVLVNGAAGNFLAPAATLSPVSMRTLALQGGPMSDQEVSTFAASRMGAAAVQVRHWDEQAKVKGLTTPSLRHFLTIAGLCLR